MKDKKYEEVLVRGFTLLGREDLLERIKKEACSKNIDLRLAINGVWGSGKTILMKQLDKELESEKNIISIYFDAWEFDYFNNPLLALVLKLKEIPSFADVLYENLHKKHITNLSGFLGFGVFGVDYNIESIGKELLDEIERNTHVIEVLSETIKKVIQKQEKRIVLIIDELDRCKPEFTIRLVEIIRHIECQNLMIIFSIDYKQICAVVNKFYGGGYNSEDYLWRIFDEIIDLPVLENEKIWQYVNGNSISPLFKNVSQDIFVESVKELRLSLRNINRFKGNIKRCPF